METVLGAFIEIDLIGRASRLQSVSPGRPAGIDPIIELGEMDLQGNADTFRRLGLGPAAVKRDGT